MGQFRRANQQIKFLTRKLCLAGFFGYQPNCHTTCMHFGRQSVLYCLAKIFAQRISLVTSQTVIQHVCILAGSLFYIAQQKYLPSGFLQLPAKLSYNMYAFWLQSVLYCLAKIFAQQNFLLSSSVKLAPGICVINICKTLCFKDTAILLFFQREYLDHLSLICNRHKYLKRHELYQYINPIAQHLSVLVLRPIAIHQQWPITVPITHHM